MQTIGIFAKRARGLMARFALQNALQKPEELKAFDAERYVFEPRYSTENKWVFVRWTVSYPTLE